MSPASSTSSTFLKGPSTPNRDCDRTVARGPRKGKLMTLLQLSIDPILLEEILLGSLGAIASLIGAIAVMRAVSQARGNPTQAEQGLALVPSGRLSIVVAAQDNASDPLNLRFTLHDPDATLLRIELLNQLDKRAGAAQCVKKDPGVFVATVDPKIVQRWYNANAYWEGETKQLPIRVFFITKGRAGCQTIWAMMSPRTMRNSGLPDESDFVWFLKGPCSRTHSPLTLMPSRTRTGGR